MKIVIDGKSVNIGDSGSSGGGGTAGEVYSTEETRIGTWVDGKPLYKKAFVDTTGSEYNNWKTIAELEQNDIPVMIFGWVRDRDDSVMSIPFPPNIILIASAAAKNISIMVTSGDHFLNRPVYVIVKYTKNNE